MDITALTPVAMSAGARLLEPSPTAAGAVAADAGFAETVASADLATRPGHRLPGPTGWQQLEMLLVQQMLQHVLASDTGGFFGEGLGSDYYASFMAEQIAGQVAGSMNLGIAEQLGGHYRSGEGA